MNGNREQVTGVSEPKAQPFDKKSLLTAALFGLIFGFLLQKGGVGKFNVLIGALLLEDFTVVKVMMSAVVTGMLGVYTLNALGNVNLHLQPTRLGAQILGGLVFGAGFALLAYCPGTVAVALGQGNRDALFGIAGLIAGSWLFAEMSGFLSGTVQKWGAMGKLTLPGVLPLPKFAVVSASALLLVGVLAALEYFSAR